MTELNGNTYEVTPISPIGFKIKCDTRKFNLYTSEGSCEEAKIPYKVKFKSLEEAFIAPYSTEKIGKYNMRIDFYNPDQMKFGRPEELHIIHRALLKFVTDHDG